MSRRQVSGGVVGYGAWGRDSARILSGLPGVDLRWICDPNPLVRVGAAETYPGAGVTGNLDELLGDTQVAPVLIAPPAGTRVALTQRALRAGKHSFVNTVLAHDDQDA